MSVISMKVMKISKAVMGVLLTTLMTGLLLPSRASAKSIVVCGPNGAARIVEKVPVGCSVLKVNTPPKSSSNSSS